MNNLIDNLITNDKYMSVQLLAVLANIWNAITAILTSFYGKIITMGLFLGSLFAPIAPLFNITLALVLIDAIFGIAVTIKVKGVKYILSSRLRDSVVKLFFYLLFLALFYLIEIQILDEWYIGCKALFAIISGVEIWSILANMLIIAPNLPFLKLLKKFLGSEMARKLGLEIEEFESTLNQPINDNIKEDGEDNI